MEIPIEERPDLPSTFMSFAPIVVPVILIIFNTVLSALKLNQPWAQYLIFLGNPVIAVGIGFIIAIYGLTPKLTRKEVIKRMEEGVSSAGIIIFDLCRRCSGTGIEGSGAGNYIANFIANTPMPPVLLPFFVAHLFVLYKGAVQSL